MNSLLKNIALGAIAGVVMFAGQSAMATPLLPQVDFRDEAFAVANHQESYSTTVDGIEFTLSAFNADGSAAELWWDPLDGIGIWGNEDDEIDNNEYIILSFANTIGLSHLFFADLFAGESAYGLTYDEGGTATLDSGLALAFDAMSLAGSGGNKGNGEGVLELSKVLPVNFIRISANGLGQNFSLLGFTDPPIIPEPGMLAIFGVGLLGLGLTRRRKVR